MKKIYAYKALALGALSFISLLGFARTEKTVQIFRNGEIIQQYAVSDIDYIEVNDVLVGSEYEYSVASADKSNSGSFGSAFFFRNPWDEGCVFNFSSSNVPHFTQLGNSMAIELYVGAKELYDGKEFNVAETDYPFSFKFQYVNAGALVDVVIDNEHRVGAEGTIALIPNGRGAYDAVFDVSMDSGDVVVKGYYAGEYKERNTIYNTAQGVIATVKGATLDISSNPCVVYFTTGEGEAGPDNYDVKGEVPANEWQFGKFMSFSGQDASREWINGVTYNSSTLDGSGYFGGNWRVMAPTFTPSGSTVAECSSMLFGNPTCYLYYYGDIKIIE